MEDESILQDKRILIVDDEPDILETLEDLLPMGHTTTAASYQEAREVLETQPFDIAILDIMGVSGFDLLEIAARKGIVAVMLTAYALTPENVAKSHRKGAAYYLPKEEMVNIASFLTEIMTAKAKGEDTWGSWYQRLSSFAERTFGPDYKKGDKAFWDKLTYH
jgi:CheY-like chemotaxis protein